MLCSALKHLPSGDPCSCEERQKEMASACRRLSCCRSAYGDAELQRQRKADHTDAIWGARVGFLARWAGELLVQSRRARAHQKACMQAPLASRACANCLNTDRSQRFTRALAVTHALCSALPHTALELSPCSSRSSAWRAAAPCAAMARPLGRQVRLLFDALKGAGGKWRPYAHTHHPHPNLCSAAASAAQERAPLGRRRAGQPLCAHHPRRQVLR